MATPPPIIAYCPGCREKKLIATEFGKEKRTQSGHARICKACEQRRRRQNRPAKILNAFHGSVR